MSRFGRRRRGWAEPAGTVTVSAAAGTRVAAVLLVALVTMGASLVGAVLLALPAAASNDPLFPQQWGLAKIGAEAAWARSTGAGIRIGIVDTGVDLRHEDLAGKVVASTNCIGAAGDPSQCHGDGQDDEGHGTHVSGTAAAATNNNTGVAGVAPDAQLVVAKALDSSGSGNTADINAGIAWVVSQGARVVNLSLGSDLPLVTAVQGSPLKDGIEYAWAHGAVPVLAAGNTNLLGLGSSQYGSIDAIVVGATGPDDELAGYSSPTGSAKWAVLAPGGDGVDASGQPSCRGTAEARCILSTYWESGSANSYASDEGTSMATPHVAGAVALLLAQGRSQQDAVDTLLATVNTSVSCGGGSSTCHGRLDSVRAVSAPGAKTASGGSPAATTTPGRPTATPSLAPATVPKVATPVAPAAGGPAAPGAPTSAATGPSPTAHAPGTTATVGEQATGLTPARPASVPTRGRRNHGVLLGVIALAMLGLAGGATVWLARGGGRRVKAGAAP